MRVRVDAKKCQGHTLCNWQAPQVFKLRDEDGHSSVENEQVPDDLKEAVQRAVIGCPEQAIETVED